VLLAATMQGRVAQILATAQAAGLRVRAVTSSAMTLLRACNSSSSMPALALYLGPDGAELMVSEGGSIRALKHLPAAARGQPGGSEAAEPWLEALARGIHQELSLLPQHRGSAAHEELLVWDGVGMDDAALQGLGERLSLKVEPGPELSALGVGIASGAGEHPWRRFTASAALGVAGSHPELLPVDFLNSRLAVRKRRLPGKYATWAAVAGATLCAACGFLLLDWQLESRELGSLQGRLQAMQEDARAAQSVIQSVSSARGWYDRRPKFLSCLRELTLSFPPEGKIWATSLLVQGNMQGIVSGESEDERAVLELLDSLKSRPALAGVKLLYMREAARESREISFAISFTFVAVN